jgi:hypothetical protein
VHDQKHVVESLLFPDAALAAVESPLMGRTLPGINKRSFLAAVACLTQGWFVARQDRGDLTVAELFRMEQGLEAGRRARALWPHGVLIKSVDLDAAAAETQRLMSTPTISAIFEATFRIAGYTAKADILIRAGGGWRLLEVKSSLHDDEGAKGEHLDDLAYTSMVLLRSGVKLASAELMLLNRDYRLGQPDSNLFIASDHTAAVMQTVAETDCLWNSIRLAVTSAKCPKPTPIFECRHCDFFASDCLGKGITHSIFELPRLSERKFQGLCDLNTLTIAAIPVSFDLTENQRRVANVIQSGKPWCDQSALSTLLQSVRWPCYYLDFETVMTAIPLWSDIAPHEQIVTQYSIHVCKKPGKTIAHREYLANHTRDCRRELAERLIQDLGEVGSIISYSQFEKTQINGLAKRFPDLAPALKKCVGRLFDLEKVFIQAFCHPDFCGRTSIKVTLPALVPDMTYKGLPISDGDCALASFAKMASGKCTQAEINQIRADLLAYCKQDTLAMVRLHERVWQMV